MATETTGPPIETTARTLTTLDLGTPEQPSERFRTQYVDGPSAVYWQWLREKIAHIPEYQKGRLLWVELPENDTFGLQLTERRGVPHFKGGLAGSHSLAVQRTATIKFAPGAYVPSSQYSIVHRENNTVQAAETSALIVAPSTRDVGIGNVPLMGIVAHVATPEKSGFIFWFHPVIDKIEAT
jgi:hypothetical protein